MYTDRHQTVHTLAQFSLQGPNQKLSITAIKHLDIYNGHLGHQTPLLTPGISCIGSETSRNKKRSVPKVPPIENFDSYENLKSLVFEPEFHDIEFLANFATDPSSPPPHFPSPKKTPEVKPYDAGIPKTHYKNLDKSISDGKEGTLYMCQYNGCGKPFTRSYNLNSHMKTHTRDRPHTCSDCGRTFSRLHDKKRHQKLHWDIRPYKCTQCQKSFARMDALNRHLQKSTCS
ncbi:hypothetical protein BY458DRAFT_466677 [Sporodiniella umbellata]|nr:hypothetical protein BY458DRAFT_466677 [Sporodiniella umbellata]